MTEYKPFNQNLECSYELRCVYSFFVKMLFNIPT